MTLFKSKNDSLPGQQVSKLTINLLLALLIILCIIFLLFTIYNIIKDNLNIWYPEVQGIKSNWRTFFETYTFFDAKTSCTIFITLLSLILIRKHFIIGFEPRIIYESRDVTAPCTEKISGNVWQVHIRNVGMGSALVNSIKYRTGRSGGYKLSYIEIKEIFSEYRIDETDYFLPNISRGFVFLSKDDKVLFKIKKDKIPQNKTIDLEIIFKGFLGGKYVKQIFLFPNNSMPAKDASPAAAPATTPQ